MNVPKILEVCPEVSPEITNKEVDNVQKLLDVLKTVDSTWYQVKKNTLYHDLISLIISQRIAFTLGRQIRDKLRKEHEKVYQDGTYRPELVKTLDLKSFGISNPNMIACINHVTDLYVDAHPIKWPWAELAEVKVAVNSYQKELENSKLRLDEIRNISGIGDWTYNALIIMGHTSSNQEDSNIFLKEDAWIRKRLAQLVYGKPKSINQKEADTLITDQKEPLNKTKMSQFLWRIKESGINKIRDNKQLLREDFI